MQLFCSRYKSLITLYVFFLFLLPESSKSQENSLVNSNAALAEKVYLQLDATIYSTGNIIWFKSIVSSAYNHALTSPSAVLYVELIDSEKTILKKKLIKIEQGIGQGFFHLHKSYQTGTYLIRAYTNWNRNFDNDFVFEEYIQVYNNKELGNKEKPIRDVKLIEDRTENRQLEACLYPNEIDTLQKNILKLYITIDDKKDSLIIKKGKDNRYELVYNIPNEGKFATLQMFTQNGKMYSTVIALDNERIDLQFFPESGELVHGLRSKVGFKALGVNGKGLKVEGDIVDEKDSLVASFIGNSLGMGSFTINEADSTKHYFAKIKVDAQVNQTLLYPLPDVATKGIVLAVKRKDKNIHIEALFNYSRKDSIYLNVSSRGVNYYSLKIELNQGKFNWVLPYYKLPEGIISFIITDEYKQPLAERLYFNERSDSRINIDITADKESYKKRELTDLTISTSNSLGEQLDANCSLLVINKEELGEMQSQGQNILSYFLLDSELRGSIENPAYYFSNDTCAFHHLDALMLTQGWRKYNYSKANSELLFMPETHLSVSGNVSGLFSKRKKKSAELILMTFGQNKGIYSLAADSLGDFSFNLQDEYGENINVLLQTEKRPGKKKNYTVVLDKKESPRVAFKQEYAIEKVDSVVKVIIKNNEERQKIEEAFPLQSGNIIIDEVEVTAYKLTPNRKKVMEEYGKPDEVIEGKAILEKEEKWSYGLYSVLMFNFPDKVNIIRLGDGSLYATLYNREVTLVVIDGVPVKVYEYPFLESIPPSEVSSFEIIEYAKDFTKIFCEVFPDGCAFAPASGNVIAIYTHAGKGIYGVDRPVGITQATTPVFAAPREFYKPKYEIQQSNEQNKPDMRALIHWEPILQADSLGKISTSFYNADKVGEMRIIVEAISESGAIGYQELEYEIVGPDNEIILINKEYERDN